MNFRIAGEIIGCAEEIYGYIQTPPKSVLLAGKPSCGKTTILRDLCRIIGKTHKVSLIDERQEIAACYKGTPQNNIGKMTDVFDGYDKADGINKAIRVMSPEIIVCDEIGFEDDINAIKRATAGGVKFIASIHADSESNIPNADSFDYIVFLKNIGEIKKIIKLG